MGFLSNIVSGTIGKVAGAIGIPNNTVLGKALGSDLSATEKNAKKSGTPTSSKNMGLFQGISGGVSFGKNQTIILAIAGVIFAVALAATRGFGLWAGKRRK